LKVIDVDGLGHTIPRSESWVLSSTSTADGCMAALYDRQLVPIAADGEPLLQERGEEVHA
jgi:hypothetical protein